MGQTKAPQKRAIKKTYWLVTAQAPTLEGDIKMTTIALDIDGVFFSKSKLDKNLSNSNSTHDKWNIIFCMQITKEQYKIYIGEDL